MKQTLIRLLFVSIGLVSSSASVGMAAQPSTVKISNEAWSQFILRQIRALPAFLALQKASDAAGQQKLSQAQPLYNPELDLDYVNKKEDEYNVVVSQTIDWFDKQKANRSLGQYQYELVQMENNIQTEQMLADALYAYIEFSQSKRLLEVARKQEKLLSRLSHDLKLREAAGDVGRTDAEMTYLSLAQNLQQTNLIEIRYRKALAQMKKYLNHTQPSAYPQQGIWLNDIAEAAIEQGLRQNLSLRHEQLLLQQAIAVSRIKKLAQKADPSIGIGAGREGKDNTITVQFSVPLYLRNNYSADYHEALYKVKQAELDMEERRRLVKTELNQSRANYLQLKQQFLQWQKLSGKRLEETQILLHKQWKSGDISTSEYLFSLQQRADALITHINLVTEIYKAWVQWLLASSQVEQWLVALSRQ